MSPRPEEPVRWSRRESFSFNDCPVLRGDLASWRLPEIPDQPFFCGRDGVKKPRLEDIEAERRNGYAWYGEWGRSVLKRYAEWSGSR